MNRKNLTLSTLTILILTIFASACSDTTPTRESLQEIPNQSALLQAAQEYLPVGIQIPSRLPARISEPHLLAAWISLHEQTENITVWDGSSWSGRRLAQFLLDNNVSVSWSTPDVCQYSCTKRPLCETEDCARKNESDYPIYIDTALKSASIQKLAGTLAHEAYHHTEPFGKIKDTLFEEYWAFKVGSAISGESWGPLVEGDEYKPVCLNKWFGSSGFVTTYDMPEYPQQISQTTRSADDVCRYQSNINPDAMVIGP